jgi:basic amino acid/polyamine antiporter, APA family
MHFARMFRTKPIQNPDVREADESGQPALKRVLSAFDLTMNSIAAIIGAGIFVLIGTVITAHSGPGIWLSFLLSGIASACVAFAYAEFAGMIPSAGSAYEYTYATMGEIVAFLMGLVIVLAYAVGSSAVAVGLAGYVATLLAPIGITLPESILQAPPVDMAVKVMLGLLVFGASTLWAWSSNRGWMRLLQLPLAVAGLILVFTAGLQVANWLAVGSIILLTLHQYHGVKESVRLTTIMSVLETTLLIAFIVLTIGSVKTENLTPLVPFGWGGILSGAALSFFAYIGFDSITTMGDECRNPTRDLPKAILWSLAICTVLYILAGITIAGVVNYTLLDANAPLATALTASGYTWLVAIFSAGILISIKSTLSVLLYAQSRIVMRMSKDGLLPSGLAVIGARRQTPYVAIFAVAFVSACAAGLFMIDKLSELIIVGILAAFIVVCVSIIILHYKRPELPRTFRCPLMPWMPAVGAITSLVMMFSLSATTWIIFGGWVVLGVIVYLLYGMRHSRLNR